MMLFTNFSKSASKTLPWRSRVAHALGVACFIEGYKTIVNKVTPAVIGTNPLKRNGRTSDNP